jgi:ABC-2 type transport system permease protein
MSRPSNLAVLTLFARVAVRRIINGSTLFARRAQQNFTKKVTRTATIPGAAREQSRGSRLLVGFIGFLMVFGTAMLLSRSLPCTTQAVHLDEIAGSKVISVAPDDYQALEAAGQLSDKDQAAAAADKAFASVIDGYGSDWIEVRGKELLKKQFMDRKAAGFQSIDPQSPLRGNLAVLSPPGQLRALQGAGLYILLISVSALCLTVGTMSRNLSQNDPALAWLFQFPVSRQTVFLSKLGEYTVVNFAGPIAALLAAMLAWGTGATFGMGLVFVFAVGLATALNTASIRLIAELFLMQCCSRKTRGAVVSTVAAIGSCGLLFASYFGNAAPTTRMFLWVADRVPNVLYWNPLSLGIGSTHLANGFGILWWIVNGVICLALATIAVVWSTRMTAFGLASALDAVPAAARKSTIESASGGILSGLVWKELLQLRRQPEFLFQVLSAPLAVGFLLYIRNPDQFLRIAGGDVAALCVSVFAVTSYLLIVAGGAVLRSELRTLWFLQCQPRPLADCLRIKARIWAGLAITMSVALTAAVGVFVPGSRTELAIRFPFLMAFLWLLAEISFGLLALGATVLNEQTVRFHRLMWVVPMLICTQCGATLYRGSLWDEFGVLAVLIVLSMAVRQRQLTDLAWLSEPVENPPVRLDVLHVLLALFAFITCRDFVTGLLASASLTAPTVTATAYLVGAFIVWGIATVWMRRTGRLLPRLAQNGPALKPIIAGLSVTCLVGLALVGVLRHSSEATLTRAYFRLPETWTSDDRGHWLFLATIVLVAPIFEEWLFRGLLYRNLRQNWGIVTSVAISTLLFTAIHPMASSLGVLTLAVVTALVFERTGRLWASMAVHAGYNAFIVALWNLPL